MQVSSGIQQVLKVTAFQALFWMFWNDTSHVVLSTWWEITHNSLYSRPMLAARYREWEKYINVTILIQSLPSARALLRLSCHYHVINQKQVLRKGRQAEGYNSKETSASEGSRLKLIHPPSKTLKAAAESRDINWLISTDFHALLYPRSFPLI